MVLRRSQSTRTTFSIYLTRRTKYQKWLAIVNVLMLLGSLCLIFMGLVLKLIYFMDLLDFIAFSFAILPWLLIAVGLVTFFLASVGFIFSSTEERPLVLTFASLGVFVVVLQITTVFFATEARREIDSSAFRRNGIGAVFDYHKSQAVRDTWDYLQTRIRCCGANDYTDYYSSQSTEFYRCVPKTCCFEQNEACTDAIVRPDTSSSCAVAAVLIDKIYVRGCLLILEQLYNDDLRGLMLNYAVVGTFLALVELIGVALAFAFAAQINRKLKRELKYGDWQPGEDVSAAANNTMSMDDFEQRNH